MQHCSRSSPDANKEQQGNTVCYVRLYIHTHMQFCTADQPTHTISPPASADRALVRWNSLCLFFFLALPPYSLLSLAASRLTHTLMQPFGWHPTYPNRMLPHHFSKYATGSLLPTQLDCFVILGLLGAPQFCMSLRLLTYSHNRVFFCRYAATTTRSTPTWDTGFTRDPAVRQ